MAADTKNTMRIADITYRMTDFTFVRELSLAVDLQKAAYSLHLVLSKSERPGADWLTADFEQISELSIRDFGGGWTQVLYLAAEDIASEQRDHTRFRVRDLENDRLLFLCEQITVSDPIVSSS